MPVPDPQYKETIELLDAPRKEAIRRFDALLERLRGLVITLWNADRIRALQVNELHRLCDVIEEFIHLKSQVEAEEMLVTLTGVQQTIARPRFLGL